MFAIITSIVVHKAVLNINTYKQQNIKMCEEKRGEIMKGTYNFGGQGLTDARNQIERIDTFKIHVKGGRGKERSNLQCKAKVLSGIAATCSSAYV